MTSNIEFLNLSDGMFIAAAIFVTAVVLVLVIIMVFGERISNALANRSRSLPVDESPQPPQEDPLDVPDLASIAVRAILEEMGVYADIYLASDYYTNDEVIQLMLCGEDAVRLDDTDITRIANFGTNFLDSKLDGRRVFVSLTVSAQGV